MSRFYRIMSYLLVFFLALGAGAILQLFSTQSCLEVTKLEQLQELIEERFIGEADTVDMEDAAAAAMVAALGDEWSHYISAADYQDYMEKMNNAYVGVGITISVTDGGYPQVKAVTEGGPAEAAGIRIGDVLICANGQDCAALGLDGTRGIVRGEEGTAVELTLRRGDEQIVVNVERKYFEVPVAEYQMLDGHIGLVKIVNFDERCADETIDAIEDLLAQGARALIFDVRNNPGGYKDELVRVLDYLLPEGVLFRSEYYDGSTELDKSDNNYLEIPMAVLVNGESYSAAEFFAAAMSEYDAAEIVGEKTYGKGYFQQTYRLNDGSAVGLSVGKYYTPNGENLAGVGVVPDVEVSVSENDFWEIYYGNLHWKDDPQILAAIELLKSGN